MNAKKTVILILLLGTFPVFSQQGNEQKRIPEGKWVLENVSAFEGNAQIALTANDLGFRVPSEIDVQQDEVAFITENSSNRVRYDDVVKGNLLCFLICAEWKIVDNKLQLQWSQDIEEPVNGVDMRIISLSYVRK